MLRVVFLVVLVLTVCYGGHFKFDYVYNRLVDGWLKLHPIPATFRNARLRCHARGGVLASPLNPKFVNAITEQMKKEPQPVPVVFIGIHSIFAKGVYTSIEGIPLGRIPIKWAPNEPDNHNDTENCLAMSRDGTVKDISCDDTLPYVCYKQKTTKLELTRCRTFDPEYKLDSRTGSCYKFHSWGQSFSRAFMTCAAEGAHLAVINSDIESEVLKELYAQYPNEVIVAKYRGVVYLGYRAWDSGWITVHMQAEFREDYMFSEKAGGWLKLHLVPGTWTEARLRCDAEGAVLMSPMTDKIREGVKSFVENMYSVPTIFTGIHAMYSKGDFNSIEGVPLSRVTWAPGEPNNLDNSEDCLAMEPSNGTMSDVRCEAIFPYLCFKKKPQKFQLEPTVCGTIDLAYNLDRRTGSCYKFHRRGQPWSRAYSICAAEGGHLAIINSDQEAIVLMQIQAKNPIKTNFRQDFAYIGVVDMRDGGSWMTVHGQTLAQAGYDRWHESQPDNATQPGGEFCGHLFRTSPNLNDISCEAVLPFICEKSPDQQKLLTA